MSKSNYVTGDVMTAQERADCMVPPVAPEQANGWRTPYVSHDVNLSWMVATRNGGRVLRVGRLTQEDVRNFDADKEWARLR